MNINILLIIIFCIIVLSLLVLISFININNKINYTLIRINEADSRIGSNLKDKYELLNRSISLIKEKNKDDNILKEIVKLRTRKVSNFTLYNILNDSYLEFEKILKKNKDLLKSDEILKISKQLIAIDSELDTLIKYYDGNVCYYNNMLKKIPTGVVGKIKKYKLKECFISIEDKE